MITPTIGGKQLKEYRYMSPWPQQIKQTTTTPVVKKPISKTKLFGWLLGTIGGLVISVVALENPIKNWLGWYPIEITVEATVEGQPVKIEVVASCTERLRLDTGCPLCRTPHLNIHWLGKEMPSGSALGVFLEQGACGRYNQSGIAYAQGTRDPNGKMTPVERRMTGPYGGPRVVVGWSDNLKAPTVIEYYNLGKQPDPTKAPLKVDPNSLKIRFKHLRYGDKSLSDPKQEQQFAYFGNRIKGYLPEYEFSDDLLSKRFYQCYTVVYPYEFWSRMKGTEILKATTQTRRISEIDKNREWVIQIEAVHASPWFQQLNESELRQYDRHTIGCSFVEHRNNKNYWKIDTEFDAVMASRYYFTDRNPYFKDGWPGRKENRRRHEVENAKGIVLVADTPIQMSSKSKDDDFIFDPHGHMLYWVLSVTYPHAINRRVKPYLGIKHK